MALINVLKIGADGLDLEHDPTTDELNMLDYQLGGTSLSGTSGATVIGDDSANINYANIESIGAPIAGNTVRDVLEAIDTALSNIDGDNSFDEADYTNANASPITVGQAVYISGADSVDLADNSDVTKDDPIGLVKDASIASAASGKIFTDGLAAGVLTGATANTKFYLQNTPGLISTTVPTGSGQNVVLMGIAKNATDLQMRIQNIGRRA